LDKVLQVGYCQHHCLCICQERHHGLWGVPPNTADPRHADLNAAGASKANRGMIMHACLGCFTASNHCGALLSCCVQGDEEGDSDRPEDGTAAERAAAATAAVGAAGAAAGPGGGAGPSPRTSLRQRMAAFAALDLEGGLEGQLGLDAAAGGGDGKGWGSVVLLVCEPSGGGRDAPVIHAGSDTGGVVAAEGDGALDWGDTREGGKWGQAVVHIHHRWLIHMLLPPALPDTHQAMFLP
jgi:hypothetical protein